MAQVLKSHKHFLALFSPIRYKQQAWRVTVSVVIKATICLPYGNLRSENISWQGESILAVEREHS